MKLTPEQTELVSAHLSLPRVLAHKHQNWQSADRPHMDDLVAEGYLGLCEAAATWDAERGSFIGHAVTLIRRRIVAADEAHSRPIVLSARGKAKPLSLIRKIRAAQAGGAVTLAEIETATGIAQHKIAELLPAASPSYAADDWDLPSLDNIEELVEEREAEEIVRGAVAGLPPIERQVIEARFGWATGIPMTASEISKFLALPIFEVEVAEEEAMKTLRSVIGGQL